MFVNIFALNLCVNRLPYVEATFLELFRYKTVVPVPVTHCTLKDTEVGGYFIPMGTAVTKADVTYKCKITVAYIHINGDIPMMSRDPEGQGRHPDMVKYIEKV